MDFQYQDALLKKEEQILNENIRVTEETKKGFHNYLSAVLKASQEEAEEKLKGQLSAQVI